jgi:hypothetical protein
MSLKTVNAVAYRDPWSGEYYQYNGGGVCPVCGGELMLCDGFIICIAPGTCTYNAEVIEE